MQLKLILLIYSCYTLAPAFGNNGTCYDRDSTKPYCCDFYEQTNSRCVECKDGFESTRGSDCIPCSNNTYGKRCVFQCICMNYQRCHHISGCVDFTTTEDVYQGYSTVLRSVTEKENSNDTSRRDKCRSSVEVVFFAFVGLLIGFGVGVISMFFKQFIKRNKRQDPTTAETNDTLEIRGDPINAYEEIDDTIFVLHDANIYQDEENSDTSSDSSNTEQRSENTQNTDDINPYQPIIPTTDPHLYMTPVANTECNNTDPEDTAVRSSSFSNDDNNGSLRSDSDNLMSRPLHYVELEINTLSEDNKEDNKEPDKYVNISIHANRPTENKASTQKTQYAEIVHTV